MPIRLNGTKLVAKPRWIWGELALLFFISSAALAAEPKNQPVEIGIRPIEAAAASQVSFTRDIKPILVNACVECHSAKDRKSSFEVTSVETLKQKGKKAGEGVIPGKPDDSSVVRYIRGLADGPQMPKGAPPLTEGELHLIRMWIAAGASDDSAVPARASSSQANTALENSSSEAQSILKMLLDDHLSPEERFVLTRRFRTTLLPPSPKPPAAGNPVDAFVQAQWREARLPEAVNVPPPCDDSTFVRRIYLDLIGVIPLAKEAQDFVAGQSPGKRSHLIDALLARTSDYAAHWTPFWEEALCSSSTDLNGGIGSRGNHRQWIYDSFKTNKPFDLFVAELMDPTLPGYRQPKAFTPNGRHVVSGYIKNEAHEETLQTAANVSQVFLGTGMKCASCHSHFLNKEWPQARFLAFAGMFAPHDLELIRCETKSGQMIPARFPFELPGITQDVPADLTNRLHRVAQLLIDPLNPRFAKTIVNRLYKRYLGLGLFEPVDDFRPDQPASHPSLLEWLAQDFIRNGYDLKHTTRLILNSQTYQLAYHPSRADRFDVRKPNEPRYFRSPTLRRLTAEQWIDSIRFSTSKTWKNKDRTYRNDTSTPLTRALSRPAARNEVSTGRSDDTAVVQSLELLNGPELHNLVYSGEIIDELIPPAADPIDLREVVDRIYWLALSRAPTGKERELVTQHLAGASAPGEARTPPKEAFGDVMWALFVSPEFQYIR